MAEHRLFKVGDIVTRDGTDRHRILEINEVGDLVLVECTVEPLGYLEDDGSRGEPWTRLGEQENNLARRYSFPDEALEAEQRNPELGAAHQLMRRREPTFGRG